MGARSSTLLRQLLSSQPITWSAAKVPNPRSKRGTLRTPTSEFKQTRRLTEESERVTGCSHDLCVFKERYLMSRSLMSSFHSAVLTSQLMTKRRTRTTHLRCASRGLLEEATKTGTSLRSPSWSAAALVSPHTLPSSMTW